MYSDINITYKYNQIKVTLPFPLYVETPWFSQLFCLCPSRVVGVTGYEAFFFWRWFLSLYHFVLCIVSLFAARLMMLHLSFFICTTFFHLHHVPLFVPRLDLCLSLLIWIISVLEAVFLNWDTLGRCSAFGSCRPPYKLQHQIASD